MTASQKKRRLCDGGLLNLEHRVMLLAVVTLSAIVLVLCHAEGRAVVDDAAAAENESGAVPIEPRVDDERGKVRAETPAAEPASGEGRGAWERPVRIRVQPPGPAVAEDLDEMLLKPMRLARPPRREPASVADSE